MEKRTCINLKNEKEVIEALEILEELGYKWKNGNKPTQRNDFMMRIIKCLCIHDDKSIGYFEVNIKEAMSFTEFKNFYARKPKTAIIIYQKDNEVYAIKKENNKVVGSAKAACSKEDKFDFVTGAKLAFERLTKENVPFRTGLAIWCKNEKEFDGLRSKLHRRGYVWLIGCSLFDDVVACDILNNGIRIFIGDKYRVTYNDNWNYHHEGFTNVDYDQVVFDDKDILYNGRIICIDEIAQSANFTKGKIYKVKEGRLQGDTGTFYPAHKIGFTSLKEINDSLCSEFIEVIE